jgi:predicted regulator of Ras-like GTPase activity (Roadblock/LC7/MglB family)
MRSVLKRLNAVNGMLGSLVVTPDGLPIVMDMPAEFDIEATAGVTAALGKMLAQWSEQSSAGIMRVGMLETPTTRYFITAIGWGYLVGVAERSCPMGEARVEMRRAAVQLDEICARLTEAVHEEEITHKLELQV